jgi:hypothetical protein
VTTAYAIPRCCCPLSAPSPPSFPPICSAFPFRRSTAYFPFDSFPEGTPTPVPGPFHSRSVPVLFPSLPLFPSPVPLLITSTRCAFHFYSVLPSRVTRPVTPLRRGCTDADWTHPTHAHACACPCSDAHAAALSNAATRNSLSSTVMITLYS